MKKKISSDRAWEEIKRKSRMENYKKMTEMGLTWNEACAAWLRMMDVEEEEIKKVLRLC